MLMRGRRAWAVWACEHPPWRGTHASWAVVCCGVPCSCKVSYTTTTPVHVHVHVHVHPRDTRARLDGRECTTTRPSRPRSSQLVRDRFGRCTLQVVPFDVSVDEDFLHRRPLSRDESVRPRS
eukprot:5061091-Prymnesium_polylepis.1